MKVALLAPVPCVVLASALDKSDQSGRVAFGTDARGTFISPETDPRDVEESDLLVPLGLLVFVYASRPTLGDPHKLFKGPCAVAQGTFAGWVLATKRGLHPEGSAVRPLYTQSPATGDTAWDGYWEVADLKLLQKTVSFGAMRTYSTSKKFALGFRPERPMLIKWEET